MNRELIYLAALLHDIGKFYQRADENSTAKSKFLSESANKESVYCPQNPFTKAYSHKHVLWTVQFFDDHKIFLKEVLGLKTDAEFDILVRISAIHHNPSQDLSERIIQKADHYASGIDRSKSDLAWKDSDEEQDKKWDSFKRIHMRSIFEGISLNSVEKSPLYQLPLLPFQITKSYFPSKNIDTVPDYKKLWEGFTQELTCIKNTKTPKVFIENLTFLLEKYTSRIPSSTQHLPDVSLFHHLKTTAAFALCLQDYISDNNTTALPKADDKPFALIGGDLSGIQKFIYSIISRGAAKNLKGRSFYLQLLVDNIVQIIIDHKDLQLMGGNIVYSSGGSFFILAPNKKNLPLILKDIEAQISEKLFQYHKTDLFLAIDFIPFGEKTLYEKGNENHLGTLWQGLNEKLSKKKSQRFKNMIQSNYADFFMPIADGASLKMDAITGEPLLGKPKPTKLEDGSEINNYTYQLIELGKRLKSTDYWIQSKTPLTYFEQDGFNPIGIGLYNYFIDSEVFQKQKNQLTQSADNVKVLYFNKDNFLEPLQKGIDNIYGITLYGGNDYPTDQQGEPKVFEEIAGATFRDNKKENRVSSPNLLRLGVLRMDVDNLGSIFKNGFSSEKRSFSRYATLSSSLDYFFKGYLNVIWEQNDAYKNYTQIIYAGGDDLFIVGKWDVLIYMAKDIQTEFKAWTCESLQFTLSGGMAIVGAKHPILKSALQSEHFEKAGKKHVFNGQEKNAFAFLGYLIFQKEQTNEIIFSLNWEGEYPYIFKLKENLKQLFSKNKDGLYQGFANDIYNLMQEGKFVYDKEKDKYVPTNLEVIWQIAYNFKRRTKEMKNEPLEAFLKEWVTNVMTGKVVGLSTKYHALQILALAARWASFEERSII